MNFHTRHPPLKRCLPQYAGLPLLLTACVIVLVTSEAQCYILLDTSPGPFVLEPPPQTLARYHLLESFLSCLLLHCIAIMLQTFEQAAPVPYTTPLTPPMSNTASPSISSTSLDDTSPAAMSITSQHHILIVTGPAGCGKSTIAKYLSDRYGFDYIEGDEVSTLFMLKTTAH